MVLIIFYTLDLLFTIIDAIWLLIYVELYLEGSKYLPLFFCCAIGGSHWRKAKFIGAVNIL